jgi:hypothetical protein
MSNTKLEKVVRSLLSERFPEASVERIVIRADTDQDGDKILRITVVLSSQVDKLDRDNLVGFVRHLRPKLSEVKTNEFPVVRFVSASDAKKLKLEGLEAA